MNQIDVAIELHDWYEYIRLCVTNTSELKDAVKCLKKRLDLRKIKYDEELNNL